MTRILLAFVVLMVTAAYAAPAESDVAAAVLEQDRIWMRARQQGDWETVDRLVSEDFTSIPDTGEVLDRAAWFEFVKKSPLKVTAETLRIRTYHNGNVAVLTLRERGQLTLDGKTHDLFANTTRIWIKEDGKWKLTTLHFSNELK